MPKLYEYMGLAVFFYTNEHEPIHVHGRFQKMQARAEIHLKNGKVWRVSFMDVKGKPVMTASKMKDFKVLVNAKAEDIVKRWVNYFVFKKHNTPEVITRKLK